MAATVDVTVAADVAVEAATVVATVAVVDATVAATVAAVAVVVATVAATAVALPFRRSRAFSAAYRRRPRSFVERARQSPGASRSPDCRWPLEASRTADRSAGAGPRPVRPHPFAGVRLAICSGAAGSPGTSRSSRRPARPGVSGTAAPVHN